MVNDTIEIVDSDDEDDEVGNGDSKNAFIQLICEAGDNTSKQSSDCDEIPPWVPQQSDQSKHSEIFFTTQHIIQSIKIYLNTHFSWRKSTGFGVEQWRGSTGYIRISFKSRFGQKIRWQQQQR